jgi:hypothetical protein
MGKFGGCYFPLVFILEPFFDDVRIRLDIVVCPAQAFGDLQG